MNLNVEFVVDSIEICMTVHRSMMEEMKAVRSFGWVENESHKMQKNVSWIVDPCSGMDIQQSQLHTYKITNRKKNIQKIIGFQIWYVYFLQLVSIVKMHWANQPTGDRSGIRQQHNAMATGANQQSKMPVRRLIPFHLLLGFGYNWHSSLFCSLQFSINIYVMVGIYSSHAIIV